MAIIKGIAYKWQKRGPMQETDWTFLDEKFGLLLDHRGDGGLDRARQVTVLSVQQWEAVCRDLKVSLPWTMRRANIYVSGLVFGPHDVGKIITIGFFFELEVTGEATPCPRMDEQHAGLQKALSVGWRGGVTCRVRTPRMISVGDPVRMA